MSAFLSDRCDSKVYFLLGGVVRVICGRPEHAAEGTVGRAAAAGAAAAVDRPRPLVRPQGDGPAGGRRCGTYINCC